MKNTTNLVGKKIKLKFSLITSPNAIGLITKETPKTLTIKIIERTFEEKTNKTFPKSKWSDGDIEHFSERVGFERKFWKKTGLEFSADWGNWSIGDLIE
jgi:hypothetical protein